MPPGPRQQTTSTSTQHPAPSKAAAKSFSSQPSQSGTSTPSCLPYLPKTSHHPTTPIALRTPHLSAPIDSQELPDTAEKMSATTMFRAAVRTARYLPRSTPKRYVAPRMAFSTTTRRRAGGEAGHHEETYEEFTSRCVWSLLMMEEWL